VQECKRDWAAQGEHLSYVVLTKLADEAPSLRSLVNPDDPRFAKPGEMPRKIQEFCRETHQPVPETPGAIIRCVLESLALCYQRALAEVVEITGQPIRRLHIVGGGCKNRLLNQVTANATGLTVLTGPVEGTAIGNVLVQALALGHVADIIALRQIIKDSFPTETYLPRDPETWQEAQSKFSDFLKTK
jgi:rhamnulokinase